MIDKVSEADGAPKDKCFEGKTAEQFMRRAIELSRTGMEAGDGGPFGSVIVQERIIVGEGWNRVIVTKDPTAHGEIIAIRAATRTLGSFNLNGCDIYTSAHPCPMCLGAIYWARIDRIFYANSGQDAAAIGFSDEFVYQQFMCLPQERLVPEVQLLAKEARRVFDDYLAKPDRIQY
jgi:tRNA(Arg) A34 adenosine deaminase TadA